MHFQVAPGLASNGSRYTGAYLNDVKHGFGTFWFGKDDYYEGEFKNNQKDGQGIPILKIGIEMVQGVFYDGFYKSGYYHGIGTMTYPDGAIYSGEWKAGNYDGFGTLTAPDLIRSTGIWTEGKMKV